jgi:hypothetical protein
MGFLLVLAATPVVWIAMKALLASGRMEAVRYGRPVIGRRLDDL